MRIIKVITVTSGKQSEHHSEPGSLVQYLNH